MFVEVSRRAAHLDTESMPDWVVTSADSVRVEGDATLDRDTYVLVGDDGVAAATELSEIVRRSRQLPVSPAGVSHVLGDGFVPFPYTIFAGVYRLGAGDSLEIGLPDLSVEFHSDYPWVNSKSRQDQVPSTATLAELIRQSLERRLAACGRRGVLMLSSGKDSVALAAGLADLSYDGVLCLTYQAGADNVEHEHAARFCKQLGLTHEVVRMPTDPQRIRNHLTDFFAKAVAPCADHATIPFIVSVAESGVTEGAIIDGGGNDGYMGYVQSPQRRKKRAWRVRGTWLQQAVARSTRIDSRVNYLARGRSAAAWPGRNMRIHEIRPIYADAVDPAALWRGVDRDLAGQSDIDRAMRNMVHQIEGARTPDKVRRVAEARSMVPVLPYCDAALAEYFFNLPEPFRFNTADRIGKVLLRSLLAERLAYDPEVVGGGFFVFDGAPFFMNNAEFVRDEIRSCDLWEPAVGPLVDKWLEALPRRPYLFHPLNSLFMLSGWRNHSPIWSKP